MSAPLREVASLGGILTDQRNILPVNNNGKNFCWSHTKLKGFPDQDLLMDSAPTLITGFWKLRWLQFSLNRFALLGILSRDNVRAVASEKRYGSAPK